jgi:16S rRNA (guanine527-N7)-methyltransferase
MSPPSTSGPSHPHGPAGTDGWRLDAAIGRFVDESGVACDAAQLAQLDRYLELLIEWNARINLTAARTRPEIVTAHFDDAFMLAGALLGPAEVVDVGSGGGLPAVPLAVLRPALALTLVESTAKKAAFLRTAVRELGLGDRVSVAARRAETLPSASFDVALSRAAMAPEAWVQLGARLVRPGGRVFVLASGDVALAHPEVRVRSERAYADGRRRLVELERST